MFVVDLVCAAGHLFEGWYDRSQDFVDARDAGAVSCPSCGSHDVSQRLSFKGIVARERAPVAVRPAPTDDAAPVPLEVQRALSQLLKAVRADTEDVGDAFAATARAIHRGDEEARPIHGSATPEEHAELADEGVPFVCIPIPDIDQN